MYKFKQGEEILVRYSDGDWEKRIFFAEYENFYYCESTAREVLVSWKYAKPIPKKEYIPYTMDTFPKGMVWLRSKTNSSIRLVIQLDDATIKAGAIYLSYAELKNDMEVSLDGRETWQPAGELVEK